MKNSLAIALVVGLSLAAPAARADVKQGVDAWNQGDYVRAVNEWRTLAIGGNADAQFNIGQAYKLGRGVPVDLPVALEWFRKAAEQGHEKASDNYGLLLYQQSRLEDAMPFIKASSDRGEPRAQYVYATALFNGDLAPKDWVRAYALMTRASQAGVTQATTSLTQMDRYLSEAQRQEAGTLIAALTRSGRSQPVATEVADATPARAPTPNSPAAAPPPRPAAPPPVRASEPPRPRPAPVVAAAPAPPPPVPAAQGRWRVQLGAFRDQGRAPALWKSVSGKVSGLSAFQPSYIPTNGLTRLLVGPLASQAEAQRLCARIKPTGTPCVVQGM